MLEMLLHEPEETTAGNEYILKQTTFQQVVPWVVPKDVYSICAVCIGDGTLAGGGLSWRNDIPVTPGETIWLQLTASTPSATGHAWIHRNPETVCIAQAGNTTNSTNVFVAGGRGGKGANPINHGGGNGGNGARYGSTTNQAGGGAGGYMGNGGIAANGGGNTASAADSGGGSGGRISGSFPGNAEGGSVGLHGIGGTGVNTDLVYPNNGNDGSLSSVMCGGGRPASVPAYNGGIRLIWGPGYSYPYYAVEKEPNVVPVMTSENTPNGYVVTASSTNQFVTKLKPYMVFSRDMTLATADAGWAAKDATNNATGICDEWLMIELPEPAIVKRYSLKSTSNTQGIIDYQIQGSDDGVNFNVIDTRVNRPNNTFGVLTEYNIPNNIAYKYYRIHITKVSKSATLRITHLNYYTA